MTDLSSMIARAREGSVVDGQFIQVSELVLEHGVLYCSLEYRGANSRGANRSKGRNVVFNYRPHDEQYSTRVSKAEAMAIINKDIG